MAATRARMCTRRLVAVGVEEVDKAWANRSDGVGNEAAWAASRAVWAAMRAAAAVQNRAGVAAARAAVWVATMAVAQAVARAAAEMVMAMVVARNPASSAMWCCPSIQQWRCLSYTRACRQASKRSTGRRAPGHCSGRPRRCPSNRAPSSTCSWHREMATERRLRRQRAQCCSR